MKVSLDGGITWKEVPEGVRVIYDNLDLPAEDEELHINLTDEGIICDIWSEGENICTSSETIYEMVCRLLGEKS
jgi:hypothetical protein